MLYKGNKGMYHRYLLALMKIWAYGSKALQ